MIESLLHGLLLQTLTLSLATLAVRALQALLVRRFGASAGYLCWLLVPAAMAAVALPHPAVGALAAIHVDVAALAPAWVARTAAPPTAATGLAGPAIAAAWTAGAVMLAFVLGMRQWRFQAQVESVPDHPSPRLPAGLGPAVLGLWRRRIVLPQDFDSAFDAEERRLMLLHEGVHLRRGDNLWNLLAMALLVAQWFNPIAWWAWRRVRADQETSCDAAVLREEADDALPAYAAALLKVQGVALTPPLATSWRSPHPLVERVRMLPAHRISSTRHRAGLRLAALSIVVAGVGGYALQAGASAPIPPSAPGAASISTDIVVKLDSDASAPTTTSTTIELKLLTHSGELATVRLDPDGVKGIKEPLEIAYTARRLDGGRLQIDTTLRQGTPYATLGAPRVFTHDGEAANVSVKSKDGVHAVAVSFVPTLLKGDLPTLPALPAAPPTAAMPTLPPTAALPPLPPTSALPPRPPVPAAAALAPAPALPATAAIPAPPPSPPPLQRAL